MGDIIPIIVTGGGAPGITGTIYSLRNNCENTRFKIITTDIHDDVIGKYLADEFHQIPQPEDNHYITALHEIVVKEQVKVILPQTTREIMTLSKYSQIFSSSNCAVVISSYNTITVANDKYKLLEKAQHAGIPCPAYKITDSELSLLSAVESLGYPKKKVVVKPRLSNGMRGLRILSENPCDVERFLNNKPDGVAINLETLLEILHHGEWPELLVTEYLQGLEYTVDVFRGANGCIVIPRIREKIRDGITFETRIDIRDDLIDLSSRLSEILDLYYCFGFQFKCSSDDVPKLLECNPRVQGTMVVSTLAGYNMIYYSIMEALGNPPKVSHVKLNQSLKFKRYWGGIAVDDKGFIGTI